MTFTRQERRLLHHALGHDLGPATVSADDLARSLAILSEIIGSCETFERARALRQLITFPISSGLVVLFLQDRRAPVRCALELWETVRELPSMELRMSIHSGEVHVANQPDDSKAAGEGMELVLKLLQGSKAGQILLSESYADSIGQIEEYAGRIHDNLGEAEGDDLQESVVGSEDGEAKPIKSYRIEPQKLFVVNSNELSALGSLLQRALSDDGHDMESDKAEHRDLAWAKSIESKIRSADTVVVVVSDASQEDDMAHYQLEVAMDERRQRGRPQILPVWSGPMPSPEGPLAALQRNVHYAVWNTPEDDETLVSQVRSVIAAGQNETEPEHLDTAGGAVSPDSKYYVVRSADSDLRQALLNNESILLVKGPRQIGKTSLLAQGIGFAQDQGWLCAWTDFQKLSSRQLGFEGDFYRVLATTLARSQDFTYDFESEWLESLGPNLNLDNFMRELLESSEARLVWFIDEADRLFSAPYASDFFGLMRSWHNSRATDRRGPWSKLSIVIGYATEAHLFFQDLNQSPFNVGYSIEIESFSLQDTLDLNVRYGCPLSDDDVFQLHGLVSGHPFLVRRALDLVSKRKLTAADLFATASNDNGPFGDHLKRTLISVSQLPAVLEAFEESLKSPTIPDSQGLQKLIAAGVLVRNDSEGYRLPCELYRRYLSSRIGKSRASN